MKKASFLLVAMAMFFFACTNGNKGNANNANEQSEPAVAGTPVVEVPADADVLDSTPDGSKVLYVAYTEADLAFNNAEDQDPEMPIVHNTLFLLDNKANTIKTIMTTNESLPERCFENCCVQQASFNDNQNRIFITSDPYTGTYFVVLCYDLDSNKLTYLSDGESAMEGEDGLLYVDGAKGYDWEEGGAYWFTKIMTLDGTVIGGRDTIY